MQILELAIIALFLSAIIGCFWQICVISYKTVGILGRNWREWQCGEKPAESLYPPGDRATPITFGDSYQQEKENE